MLALILLCVLPILAAMLGSKYSLRERLLIGWPGPRGTTSIVFGLLAFNVLAGDAAEQAILVTVVVVLGSVVIHGVGAPVAARAFARSQTRLTA